MFNKRLLSLVPDATRSALLCVVFTWLALVARIFLLLGVANALAGLFLGARPATSAYGVAAAQLAALCALQALACWHARRAGQQAAASMSREVFDKLVRLGPSFESRVEAGEASQLMGEGAERLRPYFSEYLPQFIYALAAPLTVFVVIWPLSWPAALVMLLCVPLVPGSIMMFMKRAKRFMGEYWGTYVDLSGAFLDAIRGLVTLKSYRADATWHERLNHQAEEFRQVTMSLLRVQMGNVWLMDLFTYAGIAAGVVVGLTQLAAGSLDLTGCLVIVLLAADFFVPMRRFGSLFHTGMNANAVAERILALLDLPEPAHGERDCDLARPEIAAEHLTFSYDGLTRALDDVALEVGVNALVGVTGESGSGKSTLARVLTGGAFDYEGSVTVCGCELRELSREALGRSVTVVSQRSHVFKGTFRSNLALGREGATDENLWGALRNAQLDDFVLAAGGLDAEVREGGSNLSGGQRQRLCFARALLRDTPIYVFDEIASNVDAESERKLLEGIQLLSVTRTVLVVSHRLSTLAWADRTYVMDAGRIVESGDHQSLMRRGGTYRRLWDQLQELEDFARANEVAYDDDAYVPTEAELRVQEVTRLHPEIPLMGAQTMQAALDVLDYARYRQAPAVSLPAGHPSWIPLPDYEAEAGSSPVTPSLDEAAGKAPSDPDSAGAEDPGPTPAPTRGSAPRIVAGMVRLTGRMAPELVVAGVLGATGNLCAAGQLVAAGACVAALASAGSRALPVAGLAAVVLLGLARGVVHYLERLLTHDQTFRTLQLVRDRVFGALRSLAPAKLQGRGAGDLAALLSSDVETLEGLYSRILAPTLATLLSSVALTAFVWERSAELGALTLVALVVVGVVMPLAGSRLTRERGTRVTDYSALMGAFVLDSLEGMGDLLQYGRASAFSQELGAHAGSLSDGSRGYDARTSTLGALPPALGLAFVAAAVALSAGLVASGALAAPDALACVLALIAALDPVEEVAHLGFSLQRTLSCARRILDVLGEEPAVRDVEPGERPGSRASVEVAHVSFAYEAGADVLSDVCLTVRPGEVLRVVGRSGVGKSTLLGLIMRFWDVDDGAVEVAGRDVRRLGTGALRSLEAYMTQDTYLLDATLRENLMLARPDASEGELERALAAAALASTVARLPRGLDTPVGAGASPLSDGERQRVGLCRALLSQAPILLLDEPTSNLDSLNEAAVLRALDEARAGRAVILVSHRKVAAALATRTLVLTGRAS
ncbi:ABC transporter ATP-binding protein/permease [Thermophilibacter immobilis]|uniref:ATP-binding cassette domain-containing protein n=1 Tax=Thermophilibacter immobilis TaxID=2779519 RepID=A0A7S7M6V7_9ACTN|nr:ATP-binding cassette domain-containing protein [Thermophilibacter immobilis]QOY59804.1 ATP-binding cassette domain-containing protein [Thermophilibacter immobilis]